MANTDAPFGAKPVGTTGSSSHIRINEYHCSVADAIYKGDIVKLAGSSNTAGDKPTVAVATAGDQPVGIVVGFKQSGDVPEGQLYKKAGDTVVALVADDPDLVFHMQCGNGTLVAANVGLNGDLVFAEGSTVTGRSKMELDHSTLNTTNTLVIKLRKVLGEPENESLAENAVVECSWNVHAYKAGQTAL